MDAAARAMQRTKGDPDVLDDVWANHVRALERRNRINVAWVVTLGACCVATILLGVAAAKRRACAFRRWSSGNRDFFLKILPVSPTAKTFCPGKPMVPDCAVVR